MLGVLAKTHDHDPAHGLALAVELGNAAPHLRPQRNIRHVPEQQRRAVTVDPERDGAQVIHTLQVTAGAHHILRLGHLHHRGANFLVAAHNGILDMAQGNIEGPQLVGIHRHLVLPHHAPDTRHLGYAGHAL